MCKLKEGWLKQDVERAAQRVDEWTGRYDWNSPAVKAAFKEADDRMWDTFFKSIEAAITKKANKVSESERSERWDRRFLELTKHISQWSKDPNTKTGCVIVDYKRRVISVGYNGFPRGFEDDPGMYADRPTKYKYVAHADRNALDNAPCSVEGMTMYLTGNPCIECQKSIVQNGITRVVWYGPNREFLNSPIDFSLMDQAGIKYQVYETATS